MSVKSKRKYTDEFKSEAVQLAEKIGVTEASNELGINPANVRRWKSIQKKPLSKDEKDLEKEIRRLRRENQYLKEINKVLKKSTAIFSQEKIQNLF